MVRDADGKINTVRYEAVNAMLLNEFLKEHHTVQELKSAASKQEATISALKSTVAKQEATAAQQQTEIKTLGRRSARDPFSSRWHPGPTLAPV